MRAKLLRSANRKFKNVQKLNQIPPQNSEEISLNRNGVELLFKEDRSQNVFKEIPVGKLLKDLRIPWKC